MLNLDSTNHFVMQEETRLILVRIPKASGGFDFK
jgi:hypothetical protein